MQIFLYSWRWSSSGIPIYGCPRVSLGTRDEHGQLSKVTKLRKPISSSWMAASIHLFPLTWKPEWPGSSVMGREDWRLSSETWKQPFPSCLGSSSLELKCVSLAPSLLLLPYLPVARTHHIPRTTSCSVASWAWKSRWAFSGQEQDVPTLLCTSILAFRIVILSSLLLII